MKCQLLEIMYESDKYRILNVRTFLCKLICTLRYVIMLVNVSTNKINRIVQSEPLDRIPLQSVCFLFIFYDNVC